MEEKSKLFHLIGLNSTPEAITGMEYWEKVVSGILFSSAFLGSIAVASLEILAARAGLYAVAMTVPVIGWTVGIVGVVMSTLWTSKNYISLWSREGCNDDIIKNLFVCFKKS